MSLKIILSPYVLLISLAFPAWAEPRENPEQTVHERSAVVENVEGGGIDTFYNAHTGWVRVQLCRPSVESQAIQNCSQLHDGNLDIKDMDHYQVLIVAALKIMQEKLRATGDSNYTAVTDLLAQIDQPQGLRSWLRADLNSGVAAPHVSGFKQLQSIADALRRAFAPPRGVLPIEQNSMR